MLNTMMNRCQKLSKFSFVTCTEDDRLALNAFLKLLFLRVFRDHGKTMHACPRVPTRATRADAAVLEKSTAGRVLLRAIACCATA